MRLYCLSYLLFIVSCTSNNKEKAKSVSTDTVAIKRIIHKDTSKVDHYFKNDTTVIPLKNVGVYLLDVRIDSANRRELSIQKKKITTDKIEIPTQETVQGFAINWIKEIDNGFEISIEYGGSGRYYQKDFRFYLEDGNYVLKNISINTFDKQNPEDERSYSKKTDTLKKTVNFKDFKVENYL